MEANFFTVYERHQFTVECGEKVRFASSKQTVAEVTPLIGLCSVAKVMGLVTLVTTLHYVRLPVSQLGDNSTGFEEAPVL